MSTLTLLGTGDSKGVPRLWCDCAVCQEARTTRHNRRTRTALLLQTPGHEPALLDAGGDLHAQLAARPTLTLPRTVFISHAHNDHILGLADLFDYQRYAGGRLDIYAPQAVLPQLADRFSYAFRADAPVQTMPPGGVEVAGWTVQLFPVPHGANGTSHAYLLTRPGQRVAIVTDAIDIPTDLATEWLHDLDVLVLGTAFVDESDKSRSHRSIYDIREALSLPWAQAARRVFLTHLSHDVDVRRVALPPGWALAQDREEVKLYGIKMTHLYLLTLAPCGRGPCEARGEGYPGMGCI